MPEFEVGEDGKIEIELNGLKMKLGVDDPHTTLQPGTKVNINDQVLAKTSAMAKRKLREIMKTNTDISSMSCEVTKKDGDT